MDEEKQKQVDEIKSILTLLDEEFNEGVISKETYQETKKMNEARLRELEASPSETPAEKPKKARKKTKHKAKHKHRKKVKRWTLPGAEELPTPKELEADIKKTSEMLQLVEAVPRLQSQKKDTEKLLELLEEEHLKGILADSNYKQLVASASVKLDQIEDEMMKAYEFGEQRDYYRQRLTKLTANEKDLHKLIILLDRQRLEGTIERKEYNKAKNDAMSRLRRMRILSETVGKLLKFRVTKKHKRKQVVEQT